MATFIFTKKNLERKEIQTLIMEKMRRDFTYVEDIVYGILGAVVLNKKFKHRIYNLGNNRPEVLIDFKIN